MTDVIAAPEKLAQLTELKWDTPFRLVASVLAISTGVGIARGEGSFEILSGFSGWMHADAVATWLASVDHWAAENMHGQTHEWAGLAVLIGLLFAYVGTETIAENRAGSAFWVAVAFYAYGWSWSNILVWVVIIIAVMIFLRHRRRRSELLLGPGDWFIGTIISLFVSGAWLPISLLIWVIATDD